MTDAELEKRKYPIGPLVFQNNFWPEEIEGMMGIIDHCGSVYKQLTEGLSDAELALTYRPGAMSIRQLVHHVADIQTVVYVRFKKGLTETKPEAPVIDIDAWTLTAENHGPIDVSLSLLEAVSKKWVFVMKAMQATDWDKTYFHPVRKVEMDMRQALQLTSWHVQHHAEHIKIAL